MAKAKSAQRLRKKGRIIFRIICLLVCLAAICTAAGLAYRAFLREVERRTYPMHYVEEVANGAEEFSLEQAQVYAVILCESSFRPSVVSYAGAVGLMQIMPDTGAWIAPKIGIEDFTVEMLSDPAVNVRMGCWYLRFLMDRFGGDIRTATAAYHAGQGKVAKWLEDPEYAPDGKALVKAPSEATNSYMEKVYSAYAKYSEILARG